MKLQNVPLAAPCCHFSRSAKSVIGTAACAVWGSNSHGSWRWWCEESLATVDPHETQPCAARDGVRVRLLWLLDLPRCAIVVC